MIPTWVDLSREVTDTSDRITTPAAFVREAFAELARMGVEVEIFTRATSSGLEPTIEVEPGILVRHVTAGPFEGLRKEDLPGQLCAVTSGVLRAEASRPEGWFDLIHSHYWLSGQVGWLAALGP